MWIYKSRQGTFWIKRREDGRFLLGIDEEALGSYHRPEAAADDVYNCATGHYAWDAQLTVTEPTDLSEWQLIR